MTIVAPPTPEAAKVVEMRRVERHTNGTPPPPSAPAFSEEALALAFTERNAKAMRYVAAWGKWFIYDGRRWQSDETLSAFDRARLICREAAESVFRRAIRTPF